ncbi:MAG TPA: hypothetical protein DCR28_04210 [Eubacterium sp.]|nr:hypothetical protein [Eubacterium sp.]
MDIGNILISCHEAKEQLVVPQGITHLEDNLKSCSKSLEEVYLPNSLTKIGKRAFWKCSNLKSIVFPPYLETIGEEAFCECDSLESITLSSCITEIKDGAFKACKNLRSVTIMQDDLPKEPGYVIVMGKEAFANCPKLEQVIIETEVQFWKEAVFENTGLKEFIFPDGMEKAELSERMFENCKDLKKVVLPRGVWELPEDFFKGCTRLQEVIRKDEGWQELEDDRIQKFFDNDAGNYKSM